MIDACRLRMAVTVFALTWLAGCATGPFPGSASAPPADSVAEPAPAPPPAEAPATVVVIPSPAATPAPSVAAVPAPTVDLSPAERAAAQGAWRAQERSGHVNDAYYTDLWARIRAGFALPDIDNGTVRKFEAAYASAPDYMARMTERGSRYLFHIVEEVEARGMPLEIALLPFIESAFNPHAMSRAHAAGMWQFMPATGRGFDLTQNVFRDDRLDVLASTRAALDYLESLNQRFNDWHLTLAAYNWGQGNVSRAIQRKRKAGRPAGYLDLDMPSETRNYVPKLQSIKNIVADPKKFGLTLPPLGNHPYFLAVPIDRDIDVDLAARLAGMPVDKFRMFNPQHNKPVILAAGTPQILLPYDNANLFVRALPRHRGPLASWTAWVAPRTLKAADAARLVDMPEAQLREVNRIPPRMLVRTGSTLLVPRAAHSKEDVTERIADSATILLSPEPVPVKSRRVVVKAGRKGESVSAVARRYRVSAAQVAQWNGVSVSTVFKAGAKVVLMLPPRSTGSSRATRASRATPAKKHSVRPSPRRTRRASP